jgi:Glycosyltransferase family 9 (heptosyltransferase)
MTKLNQDHDGSVVVLRAGKSQPLQPVPIEPGLGLNAVCMNDLGARWTSAMRRGNFTAAWTISDEVLRRRVESRQGCGDWPRHLQYVWGGDTLRNKRVLVRCYHGLGDTIQFIRFAAPLRNLARHVSFWVQPELLELARVTRGVDQAIPLHDGTPDVAYDLDIEIMELPHALRITPEMLAGSVPYLFAGDVGGNASRRRVGLVWRSGKWNPSRSIPIELLTRVRGVAGLELVSLQLDAMPAELAAVGAADWRSVNIYQLAARVMRLDLVITVDTMTAHLAGALGRPVWTLLPVDCDWRWMEGRSDSPWYPSMRLFRQRQAGHWQEVLDDVIGELTPRR